MSVPGVEYSCMFFKGSSHCGHTGVKKWKDDDNINPTGMSFTAAVNMKVN